MDMGLISWQHSSVVTQASSEEDTDRSTVSTVTCMMRDDDHQKTCYTTSTSVLPKFVLWQEFHIVCNGLVRDVLHTFG